jgi:hypothetical protein
MLFQEQKAWWQHHQTKLPMARMPEIICTSSLDSIYNLYGVDTSNKYNIFISKAKDNINYKLNMALQKLFFKNTHQLRDFNHSVYCVLPWSPCTRDRAPCTVHDAYISKGEGGRG